MTKKTIEIFRAGVHVASDGSRHTFTAADVQDIVGNYDPILFNAPAVIGHPKSEDPAYAWTDALRVRTDGVVEADLDKVNPEFAEVVRKGAYAKISSAFYPKTHPNNPTPGKFYLRHIGFLGASAPGVAGLAPVAFAEGDGEFLEFSIDDRLRPIVWLAKTVAKLVRRQREALIEEKGVEEANKVMSEWEADAPAEIAAELEQAFASDGARFSAPAAETDPAITNATIAAAELASRESAVADREAVQAARDLTFAEGQRTSRVEEDASWADALVSEGRLPPGYKDKVLGFCDLFGASEAICFSEGAAAEDPRAAFKSMFAGLGKVIRFDEIATGADVQFAEGQSADQLATAARQRVADARSRGESLSVSAAMTAITAGR